MTAQRDVELFLRAQFEATADATVLDGQIDAVLSATAGRRQQPAWLAALRSYPMTTTTRSFGRPFSTPAWALLLILALLVAITAVGVATGTFRLPFAAPIMNGPIVFGRYSAAVDDTQIYVTRPDGSGLHLLTAGANECPAFSPDGKRLAVAFATMAVDGSDRKPIPKSPEGFLLGCSIWSPDGRRLAAEGWKDTGSLPSGVFLMNPDGSGVTRLTTNEADRHDIPGDWSPDGQHIAFARNTASGSDLWVVNVADGATRRLIADGVTGAGAWSPDGQWIATVVGRDFVMVHPDGTGYRAVRIPVTMINEIGPPVFSPDGTRFAFNMTLPESDKGENADVYTIKTDGTDLVQITNTPSENEYFSDWGIDPK